MPLALALEARFTTAWVSSLWSASQPPMPSARSCTAPGPLVWSTMWLARRSWTEAAASARTALLARRTALRWEASMPCSKASTNCGHRAREACGLLTYMAKLSATASAFRLPASLP